MRPMMGINNALTIFTVLIATKCQLTQSVAEYQSPIILVPTFGGSKIGAKLIGDNPKYDCLSEEKNTLIWLNFHLLKKNFKCFSDVIELNNTGKEAEDPKNVKTEVYGFGQTDTFEFINKRRNLRYMSDIVNYYTPIGYTRGKNLRGASYDFRRSITQLEDYYDKFKSLIEETYSINDNVPVSIVCHSYGCLVSLYFLNKQEQAWKDKYVINFIVIAAPWNGVIKAVQSIISSVDSLPEIPSELSRSMWRKFPAVYTLFPKKDHPNKPLVTVGSNSYYLRNLKDLFIALNFTQGYDMWEKYKHNYNWKAPGVRTYCIYANGIQTATSLHYSEEDFGKNLTRETYEDGDGLVTLSNINSCDNWKNEQKQSVTLKVFKNFTHKTLLSYHEFLNYVAYIIFEEFY